MKTKTALLQGGVTAVMVLSMAVSVFSPAAAASFSSTIDFEGLAEGTIVSSVSHGIGISGDDGGGSVGVFAAHPHDPGTNRAMIFDANCTGGCSGGDDDLFQPSLGNVLIISEDLVSSDPDDIDVAGAFYSFDFSGWADGVVTVESITVLDVEFAEAEGDATVNVYSGGFTTLLATIALPDTGNGGMAVVPINVAGADSMIVDLNGSGAIDNIEISWEEEDENGFAGCTPGFWKQPAHSDSWIDHSPSDSYDAAFGVTSSFGGTLQEALERGGGGEAALGRHAVAALLNAANPDVDYLYNVAEVMAIVQAAYNSGEFEDAKDTFELQNELGCGLD